MERLDSERETNTIYLCEIRAVQALNGGRGEQTLEEHQNHWMNVVDVRDFRAVGQTGQLV